VAEVIRFDPVPQSPVSVTPSVALEQPAASPAANETPMSRRAAPLLAWVMSLSCLLLLREPQRARPALTKAAAPQRTRGVPERNF
jgi:hypothetical protein